MIQNALQTVPVTLWQAQPIRVQLKRKPVMNRKTRIVLTDETFSATGVHRIGVVVYKRQTGMTTWAVATLVPEGQYAIACNRGGGARRYVTVRSEVEAWEYLNAWGQITRAFGMSLNDLPLFLTEPYKTCKSMDSFLNSISSHTLASTAD